MIEAKVTSDGLSAGVPGELTVELSNVGTGPCTNIVFKLSLPKEIALLGGGVRVEVPRLDAAASVTRVLRVMPDTVGTWQVGSANFSYRDRHGRPCRVNDFTGHLTVSARQAAAPAPEPQFAVTLVNPELTCGEWDVLRGRVTNTGVPTLVGLTVTISGQIKVDELSVRQALGTLPPGETAEFSMHVHPANCGNHVPVHIRVDCGTDAGRTRSEEHTIGVRVHRTPPTPPETEPVRILYLSANPTDTQQVRLAAELRAIRETLRLGQGRDGFKLYDFGAVRVRDITQTLLDVRPRIVHFSGHGAPNGQLIVENEVGKTSYVPVDGMAALFKEVSDTVECVIVNACDSEVLAKAVVEHIDYVVGMSQAIDDRAAIAFSIGFYQALAANLPVRKAFDMACVQIRMQQRVGHEHRTPVLLQRPG